MYWKVIYPWFLAEAQKRNLIENVTPSWNLPRYYTRFGLNKAPQQILQCEHVGKSFTTLSTYVTVFSSPWFM